uniref:Uncharacterized protein n=1 Tax=Anguilla anguilla TaxID=7936 RepID=A0A0E9SD66_ANGAN
MVQGRGKLGAPGKGEMAFNPQQSRSHLPLWHHLVVIRGISGLNRPERLIRTDLLHIPTAINQNNDAHYHVT